MKEDDTIKIAFIGSGAVNFGGAEGQQRDQSCTNYSFY